MNNNRTIIIARISTIISRGSMNEEIFCRREIDEISRTERIGAISRIVSRTRERAK